MFSFCIMADKTPETSNKLVLYLYISFLSSRNNNVDSLDNFHTSYKHEKYDP